MNVQTLLFIKMENLYVNFVGKSSLKKKLYMDIYHHVKNILIKNIMILHINNLVKHTRKGYQMVRLNIVDL